MTAVDLAEGRRLLNQYEAAAPATADEIAAADAWHVWLLDNGDALVARVETAEQQLSVNAERADAWREVANQAEQERDTWRGMYRVAARRSEDHLFPQAEGRDRATASAEARLAKVQEVVDHLCDSCDYSELREALGGEQ